MVKKNELDKIKSEITDQKESVNDLRKEKESLEEQNRNLAEIIEKLSSSDHEDDDNLDPAIMKKLEDLDKRFDDLKKDKADIEEKNKNLDSIMQTIISHKSDPAKTDKPDNSAGMEKKTSGTPDLGDDMTAKDLDNMGDNPGDSIDSKETGDSGESEENIKKKKKDDGDISKHMEKVSGLEKKIKELTEKLESPDKDSSGKKENQTQQTQQTNPGYQTISQAMGEPDLHPDSGYGNLNLGKVSRELASFGEDIDFQTEIMEIKKSLRAFNKNIETLNKRTEYKISDIEDKIKTLRKIPELEEKFDSINSKLGPDNVEKLRKLVLSASELVDETIPDMVTKKIRTSTHPLYDDMRDIKDYTNQLNARTNTVVEQLAALKSLEEDIKDLKIERDKQYKDMTDQETRFLEGIDILKHNIRKKIEGVTDNFSLQLVELKKEIFSKINDDVKSIFVNVAQPEFSSVSKSLLTLDNEIKKMKIRNVEIEKKVSDIKAPENVKHWLEVRMKDAEARIIPEVRTLEKISDSHDKILSGLFDRTKSLETIIKVLPNRIESHELTINKLFDTREMLNKKSERMESDIRSIFDKQANEGKRIVSLQASLSDLSERLSASLDDQRNYIVKNKDELSKNIQSNFTTLKREFESKQREEVARHLKEFQNEIKRISGLEQGLDSVRKYSEKRLDAADKNITTLLAMPPQIEEIKKRMADLDTSLKNTVSSAKFSQGLSSVSKQIKEAQNSQASLDKTLITLQKDLQAQINALLSDDMITKTVQKQIQQSFDRKIQETGTALEKQLASLSQSSSDNYQSILKIRETLQAIKPLASQVRNNDITVQEMSKALTVLIQSTKDMPGEIQRNLEKIDKLEESKVSINRQLESLETGSRNIQEQVSSERERTSSVEKSLQDLSRNHEKRMDRLEENLLSIQDSPSEIEGIEKRIEEIEENGVKLGDNINQNRLDSMKTAEHLKNISETLSHLQKRLSDTENLQRSLEKRFDTDKSRMDEYVKESLAEREEAEKDMKEQRQRLSEMLKALKQ